MDGFCRRACFRALWLWLSLPLNFSINLQQQQPLDFSFFLPQPTLQGNFSFPTFACVSCPKFKGSIFTYLELTVWNLVYQTPCWICNVKNSTQALSNRLVICWKYSADQEMSMENSASLSTDAARCQRFSFINFILYFKYFLMVHWVTFERAVIDFRPERNFGKNERSLFLMGLSNCIKKCRFGLRAIGMFQSSISEN